MTKAKREQSIRLAAQVVEWCGSYAAAGRAYDLAPAHFWNAVNNDYVSPKLCKALGLNRKQIKLAVTFKDEAERERFRRDCLEPAYGGHGCSFTEWVQDKWLEDRDPWYDYNEMEGVSE